MVLINICKIPVDKSRIFLEYLKNNGENLVKNFFFTLARNLKDIKTKKGLHSAISPFLSGLLKILSTNTWDIFESLSQLYFLQKKKKRILFENLTLITVHFMGYNQFITFFDSDLKKQKKKKNLLQLV